MSIPKKIVELESKDQKPFYCLKCKKELKTIEFFFGLEAYCQNKSCHNYGLSVALVLKY